MKTANTKTLRAQGLSVRKLVLSAMVAYPLMKFFYALDAQSPFYYIPFYLPASVVGGLMGCAVLLLLKRARVLDRMLEELNR